MSQPEEGANESFTSTDDLAQAILDRQEEAETTEEEVIAEDESAQTETQDEQEPTEQEDEEEGEEELSSDSETDEDQEGTFESLTDFAEALEMPMDEFLASIKTTVKVNGEEQEVNLQDLRNGYQMEADYRRKTTDLAEQRKAFEQERQQETEKVQNALMQANSFLANAEQELIEEYNAVNWNELRELDKEEYLIKENDFAKRAQRLEQQKAQAAQTAQELYQQQEQQRQAQLQEVLQKEDELLLTAIPEWIDPKVRSNEQQQIVDFAKTQGFTENEVNQVFDHRVVKLLRMAMKGQTTSEKVELSKKKVKTLPKVVKPGAKKTKQEIAASKKSEATKKFMKTGSRDDLVAALLERSS